MTPATGVAGGANAPAEPAFTTTDHLAALILREAPDRATNERREHERS